jgi:hypothetical protein
MNMKLVGKKVNQHPGLLLLSSFSFGAFVPFLARPTLFGGLAAAAQGQSVRRNVISEGRSGGHISAFANAYGRYQS